MIILISRLCLSLEDMMMETTISLPPRSWPWALETGWRLPLCLLLDITCQELQLEIRFMSSVRFTMNFTFNLRTHFTGGYYYSGGNYYDDILQYEEKTDTWSPAGKMKTPRAGHSVAPVDDISQFCN